MRPKISMWSGYGPPAQKRWRSPSRRSARSSIGPKILLATVVVVAGVIGITGIYPQIIDSEWVQDSVTHPRKIASLDAVTPRRSGIVAAIPLPPRRPATTTGEAAVSTSRPATPAPELSELRISVAATEVPQTAETAEALALAEIPDTGAKADAPTKPARAVAAKQVQRAVERSRAPMVTRRVPRSDHHERSYSGAFAKSGGSNNWGGFGGWGGSPFHM